MQICREQYIQIIILQTVQKEGGVLQFYGWMGTKYLFPGGISDTEYMTKSGIFEEQRDFACKDISDDTPFCNETDKDYRCIESAHRAGKQKCCNQILQEQINISKVNKF